MKLNIPAIEHANWWPVEGVATFIDRLSDRPTHVTEYQSGKQAEGLKVIFTRQAVLNALPTLLGMGFCCQQAVPEHSVPRSNCGIISEAWVDSDKLMIRGGVYGLQFPEVIAALEKGGLALCPAFHDLGFDLNKAPEILSVLHMTFTAVNIVHPWAASFDNTKIWLTKRCFTAPVNVEDFEAQKAQRAALFDAE